MKLYSSPGSCSSASQICLLEAGIDCEVVKLDLHGDRQLPDGRHLNDINPKGYVPVLELDNGELLTENVAILQYIADQKPEAALAPPNGTLARSRLQEWLGFIAAEVHKSLGALFNPHLPADAKPVMVERFKQCAAYLDKQLANREFLMGDHFSVADAYLFIVLSWCPMLEVDLTPYPRLCAYRDRIAQRESVKTALPT